LSWVEEVKEILRERLNANRIRVIEPQGLENCYILVVEVGDDVFLIGLWRGEKTYYAKISPATSIPARWDCRSLEYSPIGLYAFAEEPGKLAFRINEKFSKITSISKHINITVE